MNCCGLCVIRTKVPKGSCRDEQCHPFRQEDANGGQARRTWTHSCHECQRKKWWKVSAYGHRRPLLQKRRLCTQIRCRFQRPRLNKTALAAAMAVSAITMATKTPFERRCPGIASQ